MNYEDEMILNDIEKLSGEYNYTKALIDIQNIFNYVHSDLRYHRKKWSKNTIDKLLNCCIKEKENIREDKDGFIKYNEQKRDFEFYKRESN